MHRGKTPRERCLYVRVVLMRTEQIGAVTERKRTIEYRLKDYAEDFSLGKWDPCGCRHFAGRRR